jgi:subfamily B ATP-binding cassette protein MsbA
LGNTDFIRFVGQSDAGKSTVVSLLTRMYRQDRGEITANGTPIEEFDLDAWRSRIAVVRQKPFIFDDTLERNVMIGDRTATREEVKLSVRLLKSTNFSTNSQTATIASSETMASVSQAGNASESHSPGRC